MFKVGKRVDDRNARVRSHLGDRVMCVSAQDDEIDPAFDITSHVRNGLTFTQRRVRLVYEDRVAAHRAEAGLKTEARPEAGFLKHEDHLFRIERMAIFTWVALDVVSELENRAYFAARQVGDGAHVFTGEPCGGGKNIRIV